MIIQNKQLLFLVAASFFPVIYCSDQQNKSKPPVHRQSFSESTYKNNFLAASGKHSHEKTTQRLVGDNSHQDVHYNLTARIAAISASSSQTNVVGLVDNSRNINLSDPLSTQDSDNKAGLNLDTDLK